MAVDSWVVHRLMEMSCHIANPCVESVTVIEPKPQSGNIIYFDSVKCLQH
jgi:hypothetical protein